MHIAILGNGISGITAARFIRKLSDHKITVISAESDHFFSRTALMYIYMGHMRFKDTQPYEPHFWKKNRIDLRKGYVEKVDAQKNSFFLREGIFCHSTNSSLPVVLSPINSGGRVRISRTCQDCIPFRIWKPWKPEARISAGP